MVIKKSSVVLFLFLLNVIVSLTSGYFPRDSMHIGLFRAGLMAAAIPVLMLSGVRLTWAGLLIFVCLGYLAILVPFSSAVIQTVDTLAKVAISLLMFIVAYNFLRGPEALRKLSVLVSICLGLFILNFVVAQVFGIGQSPYYEEGFRAGGGGVQQTYLLAYLVLFLPLLGFYRGTPFRMFWWESALLLMALFPLVLIGRRGAILGFLAGLVIYLVLTPRKGRMLGLATAAAGLALVTMPLYMHHVEGVLEHRMRDTDSPDNIGRIQELYASTEMLREAGVVQTLVGSELFNYTAITGGTRDLHTDYATYLLGSGLIGFTLYFGVVAALGLDFLRRIRFVKNPYIVREFTAVFAALVATYTIVSFSGQYYVVSALSVIFILWGSMLGYIEDNREARGRPS